MKKASYNKNNDENHNEKGLSQASTKPDSTREREREYTTDKERPT